MRPACNLGSLPEEDSSLHPSRVLPPDHCFPKFELSHCVLSPTGKGGEGRPWHCKGGERWIGSSKESERWCPGACWKTCSWVAFPRVVRISPVAHSAGTTAIIISVSKRLQEWLTDQRGSQEPAGTRVYHGALRNVFKDQECSFNNRVFPYVVWKVNWFS